MSMKSQLLLVQIQGQLPRMLILQLSSMMQMLTDPDDDTLTYSVTGTDASYVEIDTDDGEVRLLNPADYETKDSYTFDVNSL